MRARPGWKIRLPRVAAATVFACACALVAIRAAALDQVPAGLADDARLIVVAIDDKADPAATAGATPRGRTA